MNQYLKTIDNDNLKKAINEIYNQWFSRYKIVTAADLTEGLERVCLQELNIINLKYKEYPVVGHLLITFYRELQARWHNGGYYPENEEKMFFTEGFEPDFISDRGEKKQEEIRWS